MARFGDWLLADRFGVLPIKVPRKLNLAVHKARELAKMMRRTIVVFRAKEPAANRLKGDRCTSPFWVVSPQGDIKKIRPGETYNDQQN